MEDVELKQMILFARDQEMQKIMKMGRDEFFWRLLSDTLPEFDLAEEGDPDYVWILRDTNHYGLEYAYYHRDRLRFSSARDYVSGCLWHLDNEDVQEKKIRDFSLELISKLPADEWFQKLDDHDLPLFVRAVPGDSDYVDFSLPTAPMLKNDFLDQYRHLLRTVEYDHFIHMAENIHLANS